MTNSSISRDHDGSNWRNTTKNVAIVTRIVSSSNDARLPITDIDQNNSEGL